MASKPKDTKPADEPRRVEKIGQELWDGWSTTPPDFVRPVTDDGYSYHAIEPTFQLQEATRRWGPYGGEWGIDKMKWTMIHEVNFIMLEAEFFYPGPLDGDLIRFEYAVEDRMRHGSNICKRMITTLRSKCLSNLGLCADVHMGLFDDAGYITGLTTKYGNLDAFRATFLARLAKSTSESSIHKAREGVKANLAADTIDSNLANELFNAVDQRAAELDSLAAELGK